MPDRTESTLLEIINRRIEKNTTIMSDKWKSYQNLHHHGYVHYTINHSENFVDPSNTLINTQTIESRWSALIFEEYRNKYF